MTLRRVLCLLTILACLPYLGLKLHWLAGGRTGITDPAFGNDPMLLALNLITFALDAVAIVMAVAFVGGWGRRVPAWLIALPMWVGSGLLGALVVAVPIQLVVSVFSPPVSGPAVPLAPWVFTMVYAGFGVQGICLLLGFFFYARDRWGDRTGWNLPLSAAMPRRTPLTVAAVVALVVVGLWSLVTFDWAHPGTGVLSAVLGLLAISAAAALGTLAHARGLGKRWPLMVVAWLGCAASFAWGCYLLFLTAVANPIQGSPSSGAEIAAHAAQVVAGMTGLVAALSLYALRGTRAYASGAPQAMI